jgi:hypothetical protein
VLGLAPERDLDREHRHATVGRASIKRLVGVYARLSKLFEQQLLVIHPVPGSSPPPDTRAEAD